MLQELNKCKTEFQYWRSKSPAITCGSCGHVVNPVNDIPPAQFCPIPGPSHQPDLAVAGSSKEEPTPVAPAATPTAATEAPRAKRKRDTSSLDSRESRKCTRGRKKAKN